MIDYNIYSNFLEKALLNLNNKTGLDTGANSFTRAIYESLLVNEEEKILELDRIKEKLDLSNLKNENLDMFYGDIFNIPRLSGSNFDILKLSFEVNSYLEYKVKKNGVLMINGLYYYFLYNNNLYENTELEVARLPYLPEITSFVDIDGISIDISAIEISSDIEQTLDEKKELIRNELTILNIETLTKESDTEYKIRAGKLIQNMGYINNTKIENQCRNIQHLVRLKFNEESTYTECIVIPDDFNFINNVYLAVKEIVDYFKGSEVKLKKPSVIEFKINGLSSQLYEWFSEDSEEYNQITNYILEIQNLIKQYLIKVYVENIYVVKADMIEYIINNYFADKDIMFSFDENKIEIKYNIYSSDNYKEPITEGKLLRRSEKKIITDICTFIDGVD